MPFDIFGRFLFGWFIYLKQTLPNISFNLEMILCGLGALALAVWLAHNFLRWFRSAGDDQPERKPWPLSATLACTALLLLMFGAAIAITGIVHQTGWLMRDNLVESSRAMLSKIQIVGKQLALGLRSINADTGEFPSTLEALKPDFDLDAAGFAEFTSPFRDGDRWLYFGVGLDSESLKPLLVYSKPVDGRWIVIFADGSSDYPKTLHGLDLPFHPAPALDPIPAGER